MKTTFIYFASLLFILSSCKENNTSKAERGGEPDVYNVANDNAKMNKAIEQANNTIQEFKTALDSDNPNYDFFALKQKFDTSDGAEHIWVQDIYRENAEYIGIVGNEPVKTTEVQLGDTITVDTNKISDWMYYDEGKIVGGYTIRILRDGMTDEERKQFDIENGLLFK